MVCVSHVRNSRSHKLFTRKIKNHVSFLLHISCLSPINYTLIFQHPQTARTYVMTSRGEILGILIEFSQGLLYGGRVWNFSKSLGHAPKFDVIWLGGVRKFSNWVWRPGFATDMKHVKSVFFMQIDEQLWPYQSPYSAHCDKSNLATLSTLWVLKPIIRYGFFYIADLLLPETSS